jgi:hypothetical protein
MQYRYTVRGGYDRLLKKKVEKGTLFAVPLAVLAIVGLAALTSNTTRGPGIGSGSSGDSGQATVTKTFQETANNQPSGDTNSGGTSGTATSVSTQPSTATGTSTQGSSSSTLGGGGTTVKSVQPSSTPSTGTTSGTTTTGGGGSSGGTTTIIPPFIPVPATICLSLKQDPVTGLCVN